MCTKQNEYPRGRTEYLYSTTFVPRSKSLLDYATTQSLGKSEACQKTAKEN